MHSRAPAGPAITRCRPLHEAAEQPLAGLGHLYARRRCGMRRPRRSAASSTCRSPPRPTWAASSRYDATDMRHRAVFNGIWQVGRGFQVSGLFYLGSASGPPPATAAICAGSAAPAAPGCGPDGTIVPRNDFTQPRARAWTCACSSGFRSAAARRSTASPRCSTCSTRRTGPSRQSRAAAVRAGDSRPEPHGAVRVPADVLADALCTSTNHRDTEAQRFENVNSQPPTTNPNVGDWDKHSLVVES